MKIRTLVLTFFALLALAGCGSERPLQPFNPMGLSKDVPPEAGSKFDQARVLWKNTDVCSNPERAIELLDQAIAAAPKYSDAYLRRGMASSQLGYFDDAFDDVTRAIRFSPSPAGYATRALVSLRAGQIKAAAKDLDHSLSLNSSQYQAWNYYGDLYLLEGDSREACRSYSRACSNGDCSRMEAAKEQGLCN